MTPEDRLRDLLIEHEVPVTGDGLTIIQDRLRRRRARFVVPAVSLAALVIVASAAALTGLPVPAPEGGHRQPGTAAGPALSTPPPPTPTATSARTAPAVLPPTGACTGGLCVEPAPAPPAAATVTSSGGGTPIWPFSTDAQAADWQARHANFPWAGDPVKVGQHLLTDYLHLPNRLVASRVAGGRANLVQLVVSAAGRPISVLRVEQVGPLPGAPWAVTGASAEDLSVTFPQPGEAVSTPLTVTGRVTGYDESVHLQLRTSAGGLLANGYAPAGADQPWSHQLRWSGDWDRGALSAVTLDGKGDLHAVVLTPVGNDVVRAQVPAPGTTLVGIRSGHVLLADALTGQTLRQLSYPPAGRIDSEPARGGADGVVWVRSGDGGCPSAILRTGLARGAASVAVASADRRRSLPALSRDGRSLAWLDTRCGRPGPLTLRVLGHRSGVEVPGTVTSLTVRDDGAVLASRRDGGYLVPAGATSWRQAQRLAPEPGCTVTAAAWDGADPVAWERCADGQRVNRYAADGHLQFLGAVPLEPAVRRTSVSAGFVLADLGAAGPARLRDGRLVPVPGSGDLRQTGW